MKDVFATLLPVFLMIGLGAFSRIKGLVSKEQADGVGALVTNILFPVMVFNALFTSKLEASALLVVAFVFALHLVAIGLGTLLGRFTGKRYAHISRFLMCSVDGGNVCFPLYATIVGASYVSNIVLLDVACLFVVFLVIPIIVTASNKNQGEKQSPLKLLKSIFLSPLVISMLLGFILNRVGLYSLLNTSGWLEVYTAIASMVTAPIVSLILFNIGYQFKIERSSILPLVLCALTRFAIMTLGIFLFVLLFPTLAADKTFFIAILLYFMCPPALVLINQVAPLFKDKNDAGFMSAFVSLYMVITLVAYTMIVIFVA